MENIVQILTLLVSSGIVGQLLYYNSRKRKEAASAQKDEDANAMAYAVEWKNLYTHEHDEHMAAVIDTLGDRRCWIFWCVVRSVIL